MLGRTQQTGFTLVELMISVTISMIIVTGALNLYLSVIDTDKKLKDSNLLTEELRAVSVFLVMDVRRAGYWGWDPVVGPGNIWDNPFLTGANDLAVSAATGEAANSCILYSYDLDKNGVVDAGENFGLRLSAGAIQTHTAGTFSCTAGTWADLTSPELSVTALSFALSETCLDVSAEAVEACPCDTGDICQHVRSVDLTLAAQLAADPVISESLNETIRIRNDKFVASVP
jgi:type II secretory pathway component PulJ